ncbi:Zinc finger CW-type PWWP domain protein 1 like protein [Argiope bruennichi]|uniref:Zinc finger CW-type PWWP domain protein 1 like protein n=2 Tax=Argiope bruennichi TaxID=94029 RepID=A0A8T0F410_ARGBR|nr:Zinc finger CW-type PWWP domain protein 1 like protein [Argiope bruennichi]
MMGIKQDHENSTGACCLEQKYKPGTLVWAKVFGYPYWPAMIEDDPDEGTYSKDLTTAPKYHVVSLEDPPSRAWISLTCDITWITVTSIRFFHMLPPIDKRRESLMSKVFFCAVEECCTGGREGLH